MIITKFVHSCLLVELPDFNLLVDPGNFTYDSHLLNVGKLPRLDYIIITHAHPDHYHEALLKQLSGHAPHAVIVSNNDLVKELKKLGLPNEISAGSEDKLTVFEAKHEPLPLNMPNVLNVGVHIDNQLTHPGDSFDFKRSSEILALPLTGPWGSLKDSLQAAVKLKPKTVIPVHDWEWHKAAREARYDLCQKLLEPKRIKFLPLENAQPVEM